jgi:hypothetical protein
VFLALCLLALMLGGCFEKRYGPDPVIDAGSVETSTDNQIRILTALATDANVVPSRPLYWYEVTQAGFNYIDDQCTVYFRELFFLNRDKDQIKAGLAAAGATTAAILGVTGASAKSIAIVAQAFGLAGISTDLVAGTYLYQMPPATAQGFVKEMQLAYRNGAYSRRTLINSPSTAYHALQDYLSLCLPPTIEAQVAEHIAKARVVADPTTSTSGPSFGLNVVTPPAMTRAELRAAIINDVNLPLSNPPKAPPQTRNRCGTFEQSMSTKDIKATQTALCVPPDGDLGPPTSKTREKLSAYLASINETPTDCIDDRTWILLTRLIDQHKACP